MNRFKYKKVSARDVYDTFEHTLKISKFDGLGERGWELAGVEDGYYIFIKALPVVSDKRRLRGNRMNRKRR